MGVLENPAVLGILHNFPQARVLGVGDVKLPRKMWKKALSDTPAGKEVTINRKATATRKGGTI